jgi:ribosomal protein L35
MPKMKTHKGASKRIGFTGSGKPIHVMAWRGHHLEIKSQRGIRGQGGAWTHASQSDLATAAVRRLS